MVISKLKKIVLLIPIALGAALIFSSNAHADYRGHSPHQDYRRSSWNDHGHGRYYSPRESSSVSIDLPNFSFNVSSYEPRPVQVYRPVRVVRPVYVEEPVYREGPVIVSSIPFGYTRLIVNGGTYYHCQGVYYQPVQGGYMIVPPPAIFY
jgi:hypothetical protein